MARRRGLDRIDATAAVEDLAGLLSDRLASGHLSTLLLEVAARRAASRRPADLLAQHSQDRFTAPVVGDARARARTALSMLLALPDEVEVVDLSPVLPLGSHSVIAAVHQDRVLATARSTEVAADPTNGLALEAAVRRHRLRHDPRTRPEPVRLAALQRVLRAQPFDEAQFHQHFWLLGLVTAGRTSGRSRFEVTAAIRDLRALIRAVRAAGAVRVEIRVTDLTGGRAPMLGPLVDAIDDDATSVVDAPERQAGRGYYEHACWKLRVAGTGTELTEVGDGGFTGWTRALSSDEKERLHIGGVAPGTLHSALTAAPPRAATR